jgi:hypothetical protein
MPKKGKVTRRIVCFNLIITFIHVCLVNLHPLFIHMINLQAPFTVMKPHIRAVFCWQCLEGSPWLQCSMEVWGFLVLRKHVFYLLLSLLVTRCSSVFTLFFAFKFFKFCTENSNNYNRSSTCFHSSNEKVWKLKIKWSVFFC